MYQCIEFERCSFYSESLAPSEETNLRFFACVKPLCLDIDFKEVFKPFGDTQKRMKEQNLLVSQFGWSFLKE